MSLASVTDIFPTATVVGGELRIPSGDIASYNPVNVSDPPGAELVYGLLESMKGAVEAANYTNVTVSQSNTFSDNETLVRTYVFTVALDFDQAAINVLDVKPE